MSYELHPLCTLFPRLAGTEFDALRDDILANGLREPIVLHEDQIIDGGNRYRACIDAGVEPSFKSFAGGDLVAFVLSANLHRRHLMPGQQAAIVASAQDWAQAHVAGSNQHRPKVGSATLPDHPAATGLSTVAERAAVSGASPRTQRMADQVARAAPDLARQVAHGEVSLPKAHAAIAKPKSVPAATRSPVPSAPPPAPDDDFDPLAELEKAQAEIERLTAEVKTAEADDLKAEALKWQRAYAHAEREQGFAMDRTKKAGDREAWTAKQLRRCGKAVDEEDPSKVAAAVEAMARRARAAA